MADDVVGDSRQSRNRRERIELATGYYLEGQPIATIAALMEVTEATVRDWLNNGLSGYMLGPEALSLIRARQTAQIDDVRARILRLIRSLDSRLGAFDTDGEAFEGDPPNPEILLKAVDRFVRLCERESALAGIDAATKVHASVTDGLPADARLQDRLAAASEAVAARERAMLAETDPDPTP